MATAVLDLDLANLPAKIEGLDKYDQAYVLIRLIRKPIGKALLPVFKGCIHKEELVDALIDAAGRNLYDNWLDLYLKSSGHPENTVFPQATIAVCTRNRTEDLRRCLDALMRLPDDGQEFLVIDNCPSTDATKKLVAQYYPKVRYVLETRPGLNIARNRALLEARNEIVAFTDDDTIPDPEWLRSLLPNFSDPLVLCVNGLTMPVELETEAQEWFEKHTPFEKGFKRVVFESRVQNPLATGRVGAGANMALRKSVLKLVGLFDEALDAGTPTHSGGDHEIFARILVGGYRIVYEPAAVSWHRHRRTWEELIKVIYGYGVGVYSLLTRHLLISGEWGVFKIAFDWFRYNQFPMLVKSILKMPGSTPLELLLAELKGCATGSWAYIRSRRELHRTLK